MSSGTTDTISSDVKIKVDGTDISADLISDLIEVVVDSNMYLPSMFMFNLYDDDPTDRWADDATFDIGKLVEITISPPEQGGRDTVTATTLIKGEITSIEPSFGENGMDTLTIRGYDKSHRMHRNKKTYVYAEMKDSDIASAIAGDAGLTAEVEATTATHKYLLRNNQTDMEFLLYRAQSIGYIVYYRGDKLVFKKDSWVETAEAVVLDRGADLISFNPRISALNQVDKVTVRGWSTTTKDLLVGEASTYTSPQSIGYTDTGPAKAKSSFGGTASITIPYRPVATAGDATGMAQSLLNMVGDDSVQAEGRCFGDPRILAGTKVTITGASTRFNGTYRVTSATHVWSSQNPYETFFSVSTGQSRAVGNIVEKNEGNALGLINGVVPAVVTSLDDPDDMGRVKVKLVTFGGSDAPIESTWARVASPMAGKDAGLMLYPIVNDEVLVAFEHGDPNWPYIVGALWNAKEKPPKAKADINNQGQVKELILKSRSGHIISIIDEQGKEKISITDKTTKNKVIIDSTTNTLTVETDDQVQITAKGLIQVKSSTGDMKFEANNINFKAKQNFNVEATQNCTLKATVNCEIKATANVTMEATAQCNIKGTAGLTAEGTAMATFKDGAGAQIALTGPMVSVNNGALDVI
jgi:uncharacterized protein involved in type VI secretion and phage assembly